MARRRDYRAEEARRNARARSLGYSSRASMRTAIRKGQGVRRDRQGTIVGLTSTGKDVFASRKQEAYRWSQKHSRVETSRYRASFTRAEFNAYYDAYINPDTRASKTENELWSLRDYLVDTMGYYTNDEFDIRY